MKIHPDADLFPMMSEAELADLVADIEKNGLLHPIVLDSTGEWLVDGRNRDIACERAGAEPRYDRLMPDIDIFSYIVATNLHRRHLTPDQKTEIVRQVIARNPDKSNREIAEVAKVSASTIDRIRRTTASPDAVGHKTTGADGKSRPAAGKYTDEEKEALKDRMAEHPWMPGRELAEMLGVSHGTVQRLRRELQGRPPIEKSAKLARMPNGFPSIAEQLERRRQTLPRFDDLSREELGMGPREYGAEQHPDKPPGWTRDDVFREEHGRIPLGTPKERAKRDTIRRCGRITGALAELARALAEKPTADEMVGLSVAERADIGFHWNKLGREVLGSIDWLLDCINAESSATPCA
jgi:ParB-like chromosome segregation protein Spo0J